MAALQSAGLLAEAGHGNIRDSLDCKADFALKKGHKAVLMTIEAFATASIVSRAAIVWMRKLMQLIPEDSRRALEGAIRVLKAVSFTSDTTLDAMVFASRFLSSEAAARRTLWLRAWPMTFQDKAIVTAHPFQGDKLFGDALDKILVETRGKKKATPRSLRREDVRPYTRRRSVFCSGQSNTWLLSWRSM